MSRVRLFVESYLKKTIIEREFEFLELDDDFNLVPLKQSSSYENYDDHHSIRKGDEADI